MSAESAIVIGGGVVGLCSALALQIGGLAVSLIDPMPVAHGCSFGNAGVIAPSIFPLSASYGLKKLPQMLLNKNSPATIDLPSLPALTSWGLRYALATRSSLSRQNTETLHELCRTAYASYRKLVGDEFISIPKNGCLSIFLDEADAVAAHATNKRMRELGVAIRELDAEQVAALEPRLSGIAQGGSLMEEAGHIRNPHAFVKMLAERFQRRGGEIIRDFVLELSTDPSGRVKVKGESAGYLSNYAIVAAGAQVNSLTEPLGHRIPLISERGYHWELDVAPDFVTRPVIVASLGAVLTPSERGLRLAGLSHFCKPGREAKLALMDALLQRLEKLFPGISSRTDCNVWSGERPTTPDSLPIIEKIRGLDNIAINTGHGHGGLTLGAVTGLLTANILSNACSPLIGKLNSRRFF
ncbi:glycine/D-amino acid oxidase-like deaminating enzyme [Bradyrhizobium sp. USDA 4516]